MNELESYFRQNNKRMIHKWTHYFDAYERHLSRFKNKEITILEIGVAHGGSLQMWKSYFGPKAKIYGIDIDPRCKGFEEENIKIFIGSQEDRNFLREIKKQIPKVDILIDDGGHTMTQQIVTFEELYDHVKEDGIFLCEDVHTSYWLKYGGGHKRGRTFIEYSKDLIDKVNAYHSEQWSLKPDAFTNSASSIHFYDSIVVIEKTPRGPPKDEVTGTRSFGAPEHKMNPVEKFFHKTSRLFIKPINQILRFFRIRSFYW